MIFFFKFSSMVAFRSLGDSVFQKLKTQKKYLKIFLEFQ